MSIKAQRIASNIVKEMSYILSYEVKDSDIKFVTVTDCRLAPDQSFAKIYVTVLDDEKKETTLKALNEASGYLKKKLVERVEMRQVPDLEFVYDESIAYGKKIENIIEQIHEEEN